ncbi:MAG: hypothetical protein ACLFQ6_06910 [Candidatus Sumerlaeia bacterium]
MRKVSILPLFIMLFQPIALWAADQTTPGELILERPTLSSLGFEWRIEGDANGNAECEVQYRKKNDESWSAYLPAFRIGLGQKADFAMACGWPEYSIPDALAGSVMDLEPVTEYELRLTISDPDGVDGAAQKIVAMKTRPEPEVPEDAVEIRHVYPPDWQGQKEKPFFENIMHALNGFRPLCDTYMTVHPNVAKPGTIIKMHGGLHYYDNNKYWDFKNKKPQASYWLHGAITVLAKGTPEQPIYIVPAGDGEVVLDGDGAPTLFNLRSADYLHFEGLTVRNTDIAFHCGWQGLRGGGMKGLTVKNCWIEGVVYGVLAQDGRSDDFTIMDNVFIGRNPSDSLGQFGSTEAGYAVNLAGQGHVVAYNYVANFWDGINVFTSSISDPEYGQQSRSIDFYNNDIFNCSDQFIEADGGYANLRMLRNRSFNCPSQPLSCQPVHAGPVYWIRNIVWNVNGGKAAMKSHGGMQAYVFLHNTTSAHMKMPNKHGYDPSKASWMIQNNLSIGPEGDMALVEYCAGRQDDRRRISHNGYNVAARDNPCLLGKRKFDNIETMREESGFEEDSILVQGYDTFKGAKEPPHARRDTPLVKPASVDLQLKDGSKAVDAGLALPGINDDHTGDAPDLGAYEKGKRLPTYGPRNGDYQDRLKSLRLGEYRWEKHLKTEGSEE